MRGTSTAVSFPCDIGEGRTVVICHHAAQRFKAAQLVMLSPEMLAGEANFKCEQIGVLRNSLQRSPSRVTFPLANRKAGAGRRPAVRYLVAYQKLSMLIL